MKLFRSGLILVLSLLLLATCTKVSSSPNGEWQLVSLNGAQVIEGTQISLELKDGQAGGSSGCNSYGGDYEASAEKIHFANLNMTLMACTAEGVMAQEGTYLAALQVVDAFDLGENSLVLSGPQVALVFAKK